MMSAPSAKNSSGATIRAPTTGCSRISAHSSPVRGPGLRKTDSGIPIFPRSWRRPAWDVTARLAGGEAGAEGQSLGQARDALGVATRVRIFRLQGVGQSQQALQERPLEPVVNALEVARVAEGLLVGRPEARVGEPEILGGLYRSGHSGPWGRREDTRVR